MLRRVLKSAAIGVVGLAILVAVLYQFFGLRVVLDGSGQPHLRFTTPNDAQAIEIARHREAQRAQEAPRLSPAEPAAPAPQSAAAPAAAPSTRSAAAPALFWTDFRGPRRDGHYDERRIKTAWPAGGLTPMWKQPVGGGYASFTVAARPCVHDRAERRR